MAAGGSCDQYGLSKVRMPAEKAFEFGLSTPVSVDVPCFRGARRPCSG
jgi:hypothetical protein